MGWRDTLHLEGKGSFRGVEFFVTSAESTVGRKTATHDYPARDNPSVEDLGKASRRFRLTCYVIGTVVPDSSSPTGVSRTDYTVDRDLLRDQFETAGSGQLVHPYWGEVKVAITSPVSINETTSDGGMARFTLDMVRVGDPIITTSEVDDGPEVSTKADTANTQTASDFDEAFTLTGAIEETRSAATTLVQSGAATIKSARAPVNSAIEVVDDVGADIDKLSSTASSLITDPLALVASIQGVSKSVFQGVARVDQATASLIAAGQRDIEAIDGSVLFEDFRATRALEAFESMTSNGSDETTPQDTSSSQSAIEIGNQAALIRLYQTAAAIEGARAFALFSFASRDKAIEARDTIAAAFSLLAEGAGDATYGALMDLRAVISTHLAKVAADLPSIIEITPLAAQPSLALTYDLHGDLFFEADLIARNNIADPSYIPNMAPLNVVINQ